MAINRREFLKISALTGVSLGLSDSLFGSDAEKGDRNTVVVLDSLHGYSALGASDNVRTRDGVLGSELMSGISDSVREYLKGEGVHPVYIDFSISSVADRLSLLSEICPDAYIQFEAGAATDRSGPRVFYAEKGSCSECLAESIESELVEAAYGMSGRDISTEDRSVTRGDRSLRGVCVPAVRVTPGYMADDVDFRSLREVPSEYGEAIGMGIVRYLGLED